MHGTSGMSLTCHKNSRAVERILPQAEKLKKMKSKGQEGSVESSLYLCYDVNVRKRIMLNTGGKAWKRQKQKNSEGKTGNRREDPCGNRL